jgi:hypothetical protein
MKTDIPKYMKILMIAGGIMIGLLIFFKGVMGTLLFFDVIEISMVDETPPPTSTIIEILPDGSVLRIELDNDIVLTDSLISVFIEEAQRRTSFIMQQKMKVDSIRIADRAVAYRAYQKALLNNISNFSVPEMPEIIVSDNNAREKYIKKCIEDIEEYINIQGN